VQRKAVHRGAEVGLSWELGTTTGRCGIGTLPRGFGIDQQDTTTMTMTPNSPKILTLLRKPSRFSNANPTPARTPRTPPGDLDVPAPGDVQFRSIKADAKLGAFKMSIAVFSEAASLASGIPYLGVVAGIITQIIRIRGVSISFFFSRESFG
jgi:hypothetical protein